MANTYKDNCWENHKVKIVNVCLCGLSFFSNNFGCSALAYSFWQLLSQAARNKNITLNITIIATAKYDNSCDLMRMNINNVEYIEYHFKDPLSRQKVKKAIQKSDLIFDFTEGDSFTDIYGLNRWISTSFPKYYSIMKKKKIVLGPQTFGPFNNKIIKELSSRIIKSSYKVYSRDFESTEFIKKISGINVKTFTDIAMCLPNQNSEFFPSSPSVGINISGLLWNNGYTGNNQFHLTVEYKEYCKNLVSWLCNHNYHIYLIPHVITDRNIEDDLSACKEIKEINQDINILVSKSPMEAKDYIRKMDVFTGARMHATIAAISQGIPVIPFSYSRKFEGLFSSIDYPFVIDGRKENTIDAVNKTIAYIEARKELFNYSVRSSLTVKEIIEDFQNELEQLINEI